MARGLTRDYACMGLNITDDLIVISVFDSKAPRSSDTAFAAVDLRQRRVLWTRPDRGVSDTFMGDETGLVITETQTDQFTVVDPQTGSELATTALSASHHIRLLWAGEGRVLWDDFNASLTPTLNTLCMTSMTDLTTCLWTAPALDNVPDFGVVFAGGRLANSAIGVLDTSTGKAATFGGDTECKIQDANERMVYYTGDAVNRVFRVVQTITNAGVPRYTFQAWDTTKDSALSPVLNGDRAIADPGSDTFVVSESGYAGSNGSITGYSWTSNRQLWTKAQALTCDGLEPCYFTDKYFVMPPNDEEGPIAVDPATGEIKWVAVGDMGRTSKGLLYTFPLPITWGSQPWRAFDLKTGAQVMEIDKPPSTDYLAIKVTPTRVYTVDRSGQLWVLDV